MVDDLMTLLEEAFWASLMPEEGALVIVPEDHEQWKKSLSSIRYAVGIFEDVSQNVDEWHEHIKSKPDSKGWLFWTESKTVRLQEKLNHSLEFVAQLTAVDGATILGRDLAIYGFGAKLKPKDSNIRPQKRRKAFLKMTFMSFSLKPEKPNTGKKQKPDCFSQVRLEFHSQPAKFQTPCCRLFFGQLSSRIQLIKVQNRVENQEVAALGFGAPERVVGKEHNVALANRNVNYGGVLGDFVAGFEQA